MPHTQLDAQFLQSEQYGTALFYLLCFKNSYIEGGTFIDVWDFHSLDNKQKNGLGKFTRKKMFLRSSKIFSLSADAITWKWTNPGIGDCFII